MVILQLDRVRSSSPLLRELLSRMADEYLTHRTRRNGEEVCSVLPAPPTAGEPKVGFVHHRGRPERARLLPSKMGARDSAEIFVDEAEQAFPRLGCARSYAGK